MINIDQTVINCNNKAIFGTLPMDCGTVNL